jgi:type I restriction enzyme S subunit
MVLMQSAGQRYGLITTPTLVTKALDGAAVTSDIVRVTHKDIVENGYLCALFSSNFGRRLALRYSYGTSIPRLHVSSFAEVRIPWPKKEVRKKIGQKTVDAYQKRDAANELEDEAQALLLAALGWHDI